MKIVSLCILAYKRPQMLHQCLESLHKTIDYPCEIIVNLDGSEQLDKDTASQLIGEYQQERISKLLLSNGKNRGVGRAFQNCLGVAEGEYIFKIDTDLIFKPHWLSTAIEVLEKNIDVGAVSLFDYRNYDPKDERFNALEYRDDCTIVNDFVSSIYGFRTEDMWKIKADWRDTIEDDGVHQKFFKLAITKEDMVTNQGFGEKSVYVSFDKDNKPYKTKTFSSPLIFPIDTKVLL